MRKREEIIDELNAATDMGAVREQAILAAILMALLDIRDLLTNQQET
jgi:hypothetical protein